MKKYLVLFIFLAAGLIIFLPGQIIKTKIVCKSQFGECPSSVIEKIYPLNGKSLASAKREIKKRVKSDYMVSDFTVQFKLPNILRVDLIVKKPIFALKNAASNTLALSDKDGIVLTVSSQSALPMVITAENLPEAGNVVGTKNLLALELIDGVNKMYQTGTGTIEGDTLLVELPGGVRVIFPLVDTDKDLLLGSLRLIYSNIQGTENGQKYSQIDLRYKNPVLK